MTINPTRKRSEVPAGERWNLSQLFSDDQAWETGLAEFKEAYPGLEGYRGSLGHGPDRLLEFLEKYFTIQLLGERLGYYAFLRMSEDQGDSTNQSRQGRFAQAEAAASSALSFVSPEIQSIDSTALASWIGREDFASYRIYLQRMLRLKPHILSAAEERILALQGESAQTASNSFDALMDVDMDFGQIDTPDGPLPLTNGTLGSLLQKPDRSIRRQAFAQYHGQLKAHENTIASLYAGSVNQDIFVARARGFKDSLEAALFPDNVSTEVYENLVNTVSSNLPALHEYYRLRKEKLGLEDFGLEDTKVPLVGNVTMNHSYEQAVDLIMDALAPLGNEYCNALGAGLRGGKEGGWVDRYENKGKRSGAFSAGSFAGEPYILMNYKEDLLRDVFTLAHEGGHSMHSWYSARNNPFPHYNYTIFEAEVASTFNEQLLFHHMMNIHRDEKLQAYLVNKQIDDMIGTIFRQTMFAEYELRCHRMVEAGQALTVDSLKAEYRTLLEKYFGPDVKLPDNSDLEGLRIPHFYRAFYVYKYATGLSASIALSRRVLEGGDAEREAYFSFLKSGGSRFPLESLALAGVDMSSAEPIQQAMDVFSGLNSRLKQLLS